MTCRVHYGLGCKKLNFSKRSDLLHLWAQHSALTLVPFIDAIGGLRIIGFVKVAPLEVSRHRHVPLRSTIPNRCWFFSTPTTIEAVLPFICFVSVYTIVCSLHKRIALSSVPREPFCCLAMARIYKDVADGTWRLLTLWNSSCSIQIRCPLLSVNC